MVIILEKKEENEEILFINVMNVFFGVFLFIKIIILKYLMIFVFGKVWL